jgi:hypothetical protein
MVKKLITILFLTIAINLLTVNFCSAALPTLVPEECRGRAEVASVGGVTCADCPANQGERAGCCCNLSSVERMIFNIAQIILGVAGSLTLLVFVISGGKYILSGFATLGLDLRAEAKKGMTKAIIGLLIILASGIILKVIIKVLTSA